jgi:ferredoxin-NADP reductase
MSREKFSLILKSQQEIAPQVRHFVFERADGQPFDFIPGQFINLFFEYEGQMVQRSYSLANLPGEKTLALALSYITSGKASEYLFRMQLGDTIEASGPFGRLTLREETPKRYVLVATGTGVTPYLSMLNELKKRMDAHGITVVLLLGSRTTEELLYRSIFVDFMEKEKNFEFIGCCSRTEPHEPYLRKGYVQDQFDGLKLDPATDMVFLCGNPNMIDAAYAKLTSMGFTAANVRREKYVSSN